MGKGNRRIALSFKMALTPVHGAGGVRTMKIKSPVHGAGGVPHHENLAVGVVTLLLVLQYIVIVKLSVALRYYIVDISVMTKRLGTGLCCTQCRSQCRGWSPRTPPL